MEDNKLTSEQWHEMWEEAKIQLDFWMGIKKAASKESIKELEALMTRYENKED